MRVPDRAVSVLCACAFGTATFTMPFGVGASAAPNEPTTSPTPRAMLSGLARDLHLSMDQARDRIARQRESLRIATSLPHSVREHSAGEWLDENTGELVVAVTTRQAAGTVRAAGARPKMVSRGPAELDRLMALVEGRLGSDTAGVNSWGIDPVTNSVVVQVNVNATNDTTRRFLNEITALGEGVRVVEVEHSPRQQGGQVNPGDPWWPGNESNCSVGFAATDAGGGRRFLTAGHCTDGVNQPAYGDDNQRDRLGTSNKDGTHSVNAREGDMGVVAVTEPGWGLSAEVNTWGNPPVTVSGATEPVVGQAVCHSGNASHWQCGEVRRVDQTIDYGDVVIEGLATSSACSQGGDSGGAWLAGDKAVGLHSGGPSQCVEDPGPGQESVFQPVNEALRKWDLTLTGTTSSG